MSVKLAAAIVLVTIGLVAAFTFTVVKSFQDSVYRTINRYPGVVGASLVDKSFTMIYGIMIAVFVLVAALLLAELVAWRARASEC